MDSGHFPPTSRTGGLPDPRIPRSPRMFLSAVRTPGRAECVRHPLKGGFVGIDALAKGPVVGHRSINTPICPSLSELPRCYGAPRNGGQGSRPARQPNPTLPRHFLDPPETRVGLVFMTRRPRHKCPPPLARRRLPRGSRGTPAATLVRRGGSAAWQLRPTHSGWGLPAEMKEGVHHG